MLTADASKLTSWRPDGQNERHSLLTTANCPSAKRAILPEKLQLIYHWRQLPQVPFLSRPRFCRDKTCLLSRQTRVCRDKTFVVTKMVLVAAPANDTSQPLRFHCDCTKRLQTNVLMYNVHSLSNWPQSLARLLASVGKLVLLCFSHVDSFRWLTAPKLFSFSLSFLQIGFNNLLRTGLCWCGYE